MRNKMIAFAILGAMLCGAPCYAKDATTEKSYEYLKKWVGKYPTAVHEGNLSNLPPQPAIWDDPAVRSGMTNSIGEERFNLLITGWQKDDNPLVSVIRRVDDYIVFFACKPHSECKESAIVYIDTRDGKSQICYGRSWFDKSGKTKSVGGDGCNYSQPSELKDFLIKYGM